MGRQPSSRLRSFSRYAGLSFVCFCGSEKMTSSICSRWTVVSNGKITVKYSPAAVDVSYAVRDGDRLC